MSQILTLTLQAFFIPTENPISSWFETSIVPSIHRALVDSHVARNWSKVL